MDGVVGGRDRRAAAHEAVADGETGRGGDGEGGGGGRVARPAAARRAIAGDDADGDGEQYAVHRVDGDAGGGADGFCGGVAEWG